MDRFGNESAFPLPAVRDEAVPEQEKAVARLGGVCVDAAAQVVLPPSQAEYYAVTDLQGRILRTGPYAPVVSLDSLQPGWYLVRTLQRSGLSHVVAKVWKRE